MTASPPSREDKAAAREWNKAREMFKENTRRNGFNARGLNAWKALVNTTRSK